MEENNNRWSGWCWIALISFLTSCFTFYKGIDKMVNYSNGDYYPYDIVNAYVGGDAYNYIINGNYATAYFVLTAMLVLAAIGFIVVHYLNRATRQQVYLWQAIKEMPAAKQEDEKSIKRGTLEDIEANLPKL